MNSLYRVAFPTFPGNLIPGDSEGTHLPEGNWSSLVLYCSETSSPCELSVVITCLHGDVPPWNRRSQELGFIGSSWLQQLAGLGLGLRLVGLVSQATR